MRRLAQVFSHPLQIERDDGAGGFAALLQKRAAKSAEANRGVFSQKESEADIQWKKVGEPTALPDVI